MSEDRLAKLRGFLETDPDDSFTTYALALEHASLGERDKAVELLEALLKRDPRYVPAYQQLGYLYLELERPQAAQAILRTGIEVSIRENDHHAGSEMQDALDALEEP